MKGEIFVFGGYHKYTCFVNNIPLNMIKSVEKYSPVTKTWSTVASMRDDHKNYSACAFMDSIYIIGGNNGFSNSCFKFNTKDYQLKEMSQMKAAKCNTASVVFEEKFLATGRYRKSYLTIDSCCCRHLEDIL